MFLATDTAWAPWYVALSDDKRRARLNVITHLLSKIPYKDVARQKAKLPKRHVNASNQTDYPFKRVPEVYSKIPGHDGDGRVSKDVHPARGRLFGKNAGTS